MVGLVGRVGEAVVGTSGESLPIYLSYLFVRPLRPFIYHMSCLCSSGRRVFWLTVIVGHVDGVAGEPSINRRDLLFTYHMSGQPSYS